MSKEFQDQEACREQLRHILLIKSDADEATQAMLDGLVSSCIKETAPSSSLGFGIRIRRWVIRDEDLDLFATVRDSIAPLAAVGFALGSLTLGSIAAIAFALMQLLRNAYRAGVVISVPQMQILAVLNQAKVPQTVDQILERLPQNKEFPWSREQITKELQDLKEAVARNGKIEIVDTKSDGRWFLSGV